MLSLSSKIGFNSRPELFKSTPKASNCHSKLYRKVTIYTTTVQRLKTWRGATEKSGAPASLF